MNRGKQVKEQIPEQMPEAAEDALKAPSQGSGARQAETGELGALLDRFLHRDLQQIILSNTRDAAQGSKVKVRPVLLKGELVFQETLYRGTQVFHENLSREAMRDKLQTYLRELFKQGEFMGAGETATVLVSKKGKVTIRRRGQAPDAQEAAETLSHNREKHYILPEGTPVDFLVGLGVQTPEGKVVKAKYDKFRQINRYLEFIEDVLDVLPQDRTIRIIDFGCGKSYLTFAMYYYLYRQQGRDVQITGLDLKTDVIRHCNELAERLHYDHLRFERGDISTYEGTDCADMVVSLHACDKATDFALEKAVKWNARVILAVPCCQHELNGQMRCALLQPVLKYGVIKERMAALLTDALRANLLEQNGYDTQILEFISLEHTPKNLLIRAVRRGRTMQASGAGETARIKRKASGSDVREIMDFLHVEPTLERLLHEEIND